METMHYQPILPHHHSTALTLADLIVARSSQRSDLTATSTRTYVTTTTHFFAPTRPEKRRKVDDRPLCLDRWNGQNDWEEEAEETDSDEEEVCESAEVFRPFERVPMEVKERIMGFVDLRDLGRLQRVDKSFRALLTLPHLYSHLVLTDTDLHPTFLSLLPTILPGAQSLSLPSFPLQTLHSFLPAPLLSTRLVHLDLSFSSVTDQLLFQIGEEALSNVRVVNLKGCRAIRDGAWLAEALTRCEKLDLSWSGVERLPSGENEGEKVIEDMYDEMEEGSDDSGFFEESFVVECHMPRDATPTPFRSLIHLSLSSAPRLSPETISSFLSSLPPTLATLDLSHLGLSSHVLATLDSANLKSINLIGNDMLTRSSIDRLDRRWGSAVEVKHNAVLESDDVEDVRRFVELITGSGRREE